MDSANQGNCWVNDEIIRRVHEKEKKINKKDSLPIECRICKYFIDDEEHEPRFFCTFEGEAELIENCEEFKLGKWALVEFLKEMKGDEKE